MLVLPLKQRWFSGRILACHAGGPGSIPGRCIFRFLDKTQRKLNEQICALEDELFFLEEKEKKTPFVVSLLSRLFNCYKLTSPLSQRL